MTSLDRIIGWCILGIGALSAGVLLAMALEAW